MHLTMQLWCCCFCGGVTPDVFRSYLNGKKYYVVQSYLKRSISTGAEIVTASILFHLMLLPILHSHRKQVGEGEREMHGLPLNFMMHTSITMDFDACESLFYQFLQDF